MATANVSAKDVMALRQKTGLGMMDCKKALVEADGDIATAESNLRASLKGKMDERTDRAAGEGTIAIHIGDGVASIIEIRSETDFTARNDGFTDMAAKIAEMAIAQDPGNVEFTDAMKEILDEVRITTGENISFARGTVMTGGGFGKYLHHDGKLGVLIQASAEVPQDVGLGISQHVAAHIPTPLAVDEAGLDQAIVEAKRTEVTQEAIDSGKPPEIAEKMAAGRMRKYFEQVTLLGQKYIKDPDGNLSVGETLPDGVTCGGFVRMRVGESSD